MANFTDGANFSDIDKRLKKIEDKLWVNGPEMTIALELFGSDVAAGRNRKITKTELNDAGEAEKTFAKAFKEGGPTLSPQQQLERRLTEIEKKLHPEGKLSDPWNPPPFEQRLSAVEDELGFGKKQAVKVSPEVEKHSKLVNDQLRQELKTAMTGFDPDKPDGKNVLPANNGRGTFLG